MFKLEYNRFCSKGVANEEHPGLQDLLERKEKVLKPIKYELIPQVMEVNHLQSLYITKCVSHLEMVLHDCAESVTRSHV